MQAGRVTSTTTTIAARSRTRAAGGLAAVARATFVAIVSLDLAFVAAPVPAQAAPPKVTVSLRVSHSSLAKGEMVWIRGKVRSASSGKPVKGAKVRIEQRTSDGWQRLATRKSKANGKYTFRFRPEAAGTIRARVVKSAKARKATSPQRSVRFTTADRSLEQRSSALGKRTGKAKGKVRSAKVTKKTTATWRNYSKMMLVEVAKPKKTRTWLVYGDIRTAYRKAGGPKGRLGVPLADPKCGLRETGCVQRFSGGAVYDNKNTKKATVVYGKGRRTEVLAAALSQNGYAGTSRSSKFNTWINSTGQPWCSAFISWAGEAAGSDAIPKHARLYQLMRDLQANAPERFSTKPKRGALVFFDNDDDGVREPTHIGIVLRVRKNSIVTVEGNTSNPATRSGRGVYKKVRSKSHPIYYWHPKY